ncbi:MAG TPA: glycosyltransferase [Pyrinomonadaceae bacterium]|jgi:GT2 family glycosyltransferase
MKAFSAHPLVSIAIPTYSRLRYLKEAVASALAQDYPNIEIIIGDDGRTDAIHEWSEALARREPKVRYQRNEHNLGLAGNWNALADAARGEFMVMIGDDDRLLPEFVSTLLAMMPFDAQVGFSNHYLIDGQGERLEAEGQQLTRQYHRHLLNAGEVASVEACVWRNSIPMSAALVRTDAIKRLRFKEDLNTPEIELFARLAQAGGRLFFTPQYLSEYRVHPQSATASGLWGERLVKYLQPIQVSPDVEPLKRKFMSSLLVSAVDDCLRRRARDMALQYFADAYYPRPGWRNVKSLSQWLCLGLPAFIGLPLYQHLHRIKSAMRSLGSMGVKVKKRLGPKVMRSADLKAQLQ